MTGSPIIGDTDLACRYVMAKMRRVPRITRVFAGVPKAGDGKKRLLGFLKQAFLAFRGKHGR